MPTKGDDRQWIHRGTELPRITGASDSEGDNIIDAIDSELTPPLEMKETSTPDLVLNIGNIAVVNPETGLTRTIAPINGLLPVFASGTVTFPASTGGNAVPSSGSNIVITVASGNFLKVGIYLLGNGDLLLLAGTEGASEVAATNPGEVTDTYFIGHQVLENVAGTIQNITNARISQYPNGQSGDRKVKVSTNDTTGGFLNGKLVGGTNITLVEGNDGGDETLTINGANAESLETNDDSTEAGAITITSGKRRWESDFTILGAHTWTINAGGRLAIEGSLTVSGILIVNGICRIF